MKRSCRYLSLAIGLLLISSLVLSAQNKIDNSLLRKAIKAYKRGDLSKAKDEYQKVLAQDSLQTDANYGQGNLLYQGRRWDEALAHYDKAAKNAQLSPEKTASLWHNMGNVYMQKKDYAQAIKSYENALIANPSDEQTRYNLVLAQKLQQRNQQNKNNQSNSPQNNPNNSNQQQKQDNKEGNNKKKEDPEKNDKDKQRENGNPNQNSQQNSEDGKISKEQADQLLNAFKQDDDQTRRRYEERKQAKEKHNNSNKKRW